MTVDGITRAVGGRRVCRRIGLIGDAHAEDALLEAALAALQARGLDLIVSTGDIVDGPGSVDRCCELLTSRGVAVVRPDAAFFSH